MITRMHEVAVIAMNGVIPFDLATPEEIFGRVALHDGPRGDSRDRRDRPGYRVRVCAPQREVDAGSFRLTVDAGLDALARAHTIIVPGVANIDTPVPDALVRALVQAHDAGARIASICSGAFVLAATGLLDGKRATTHWLAAPLLAKRFARVRVDANVLFVDEGQVLTSAGAAAGIDLCIHLVRRDYGAAVAARVARLSVVAAERDGGQAQFIEHRSPDDQGSLTRLFDWIEEHVHQAITIDELARRAKTSPRSLTRRFNEQTGTSPLQWITRARVRRAKILLETTTLSIDRVAEHAGFRSASALRTHFQRVTGASPVAYRAAFRRASGER